MRLGSPVTVAPTSARFNRSEWSSAFRNVDEELTNVPLKPVRGEVPDALRGSLYRNGPGRLERDGQRVHHPFDGDGMITALHFDVAVSYTHLTLPTNREV